jgi:murein L,D-transpeptidase YafK
VPVARTVQMEKPPEAPVCDLPYCSVNLDYPLAQITRPKVYVQKSERRLLLIQDKVLVRNYHIGLGPSPRGDKYFRGDGRTPEGDYIICSRNGSSQYYKSFGINYPSARHAENGLHSGTITYNDYCQIVQANDAMKMPPANTALGGLIMIHGGGCAKDWTLGCMAVQNSAMDELFEVITVGTPVTIVP